MLEHRSENCEKQRQRVASIKRRIRRKALNFEYKLRTGLVTEYDAVFVDVEGFGCKKTDVGGRSMLEDSQTLATSRRRLATVHHTA